MINSRTGIDKGELKYDPDFRDEVYQFRLYDAQIREMFEPEVRAIIYLTLIILGLAISIIFI
jgi:hypothetical protein